MNIIPLPTPKTRVELKEEFLMAWALARANCVDGNLDADAVVAKANAIWNRIQAMKVQ
jgi:hypothetical protein